MSEDLFNSPLWRWHIAHRPNDYDELRALGKEALGLIVSSVKSGAITSIDGVNSPTSKRIKEFHGDHDFEMNSHWICTAQSWVCPCCNRDKFKISRIGNQKQILAKLVIHHDHMGEALKNAFNTEFVAAGTETAQTEGLLLVDRIGNAFAAYKEILVCEDCNNADAEAKKFARTPEYFSFSIGQIRKFIQIEDHVPHQILGNEAKRMWEDSKPAYDLRMKLIRAVAHAAVTDSHWHESYPHPINPVPTLGNRGGIEDFILDWVSITPLCDALGPPPKVKIRNLSRWRVEDQAPCRPLPRNYVAMLLSNSARVDVWNNISDGWRCPICNRTKQETVYMKDGKPVFNPNSNPKRYWRDAPMICGHCTATLMALKRESADSASVEPEHSYSFTSPKELSAIIIPRPNSPHLIKKDEAAALVDEVIQRLIYQQNESEFY